MSINNISGKSQSQNDASLEEKRVFLREKIIAEVMPKINLLEKGKERVMNYSEQKRGEMLKSAFSAYTNKEREINERYKKIYEEITNDKWKKKAIDKLISSLLDIQLTKEEIEQMREALTINSDDILKAKREEIDVERIKELKNAEEEFNKAKNEADKWYKEFVSKYNSIFDERIKEHKRSGIKLIKEINIADEEKINMMFNTAYNSATNNMVKEEIKEDIQKNVNDDQKTADDQNPEIFVPFFFQHQSVGKVLYEEIKKGAENIKKKMQEKGLNLKSVAQLSTAGSILAIGSIALFLRCGPISKETRISLINHQPKSEIQVSTSSKIEISTSTVIVDKNSTLIAQKVSNNSQVVKNDSKKKSDLKNNSKINLDPAMKRLAYRMQLLSLIDKDKNKLEKCKGIDNLVINLFGDGTKEIANKFFEDLEQKIKDDKLSTKQLREIDALLKQINNLLTLKINSGRKMTIYSLRELEKIMENNYSVKSIKEVKNAVTSDITKETSRKKKK